MTGLLYLSRADVEATAIPVAEVIADVEAAFAAKGRGEVEMPPKPGIHPRPDAFIHAMPAFVRSKDIAGIKWVAGYPENARRGLPYISGLIVLNDAGTGLPVAVMDAAWITAIRTGAATAVAAKHLARTDAAQVAIIGCGVQGRSNLDALRCVLPHLARVLAYDVNPEAEAAFTAYAAARHHLSVTQCGTAEEAVRPADVVVTATPILAHPHPVLPPEWLKPGVFVCALDFDSYVTPAAFAAADRICTDDVAQLDHYRAEGVFHGVPPHVVDLGDVVSGRTRGRGQPGERIISVNLGIAMEDVVCARRVYDVAVRSGRGTPLVL